MMHYPADYPRINQFQEWFTVDDNKTYRIKNIGSNKTTVFSGKTLEKGMKVEVKPGEVLYLELIETMH
jgi:outer membrane protein assembly factor BamA